MTRVVLRYPDYPGSQWAMWAEFSGQIIRYYGDRVVLFIEPVPNTTRPSWTVVGSDYFLSAMIDLTCTVLSQFHRYRMARRTDKKVTYNA